MKKLYTIKIFPYILFCFCVSSCDDFVKIDPPQTVLVKSTVFDSDATANAAMQNIYYQLGNSGFASGTLFSVSFLGSLLADEQTNYYQGSPLSTAEFQQFNDNTLKPNNSQVQSLWSDLYKRIYEANAVLEGLTMSSDVSANMKSQLTGEAKFIRAFCHFYLVNIWGDVPLVVATDFRINSQIARTSKTLVYQQIVEDLKSAETLLPTDYSFSGNERVRAHRWAAAAMLSRVYLYTGDWANAEAEATEVINNSTLYNLMPALSDVFLRNSNEAILQWWSMLRPNDRGTFRFVDDPFYGAITPSLQNGFENGDLRKTTWTSLTSTGYYRTLKYTSAADNPPAQYSTVLRLSEQYLIRAEARAQQSNIAGSQADINRIRHRAGLGDTPAGDKESLLLVIEQERRFELFNEWGHRWLDLKRTNRADVVLRQAKPDWVATAVLFPLPEQEMINNASLANAQNPGY